MECWHTADGLVLNGYYCLYASNAAFMDVEGYAPQSQDSLQGRESIQLQAIFIFFFTINLLKEACHPIEVV